MTKPLTLMSLMRPALNSSGTMSPALLPLLSAPFSTKLDAVAPWPLFSRLSILCLWMSPSRRVRPLM